MASTDRTREIAAAEGARIVSLPNLGHCEMGRQQLLDAVNANWIILLDADETLSSGGIEELRSLAARTPETTSAYRIPRITFLGNTLIRGSGWSVNFECPARFFRRSQVHWAQNVHALPVFDGDVAFSHRVLTYAFSTPNWDDLSHFLEKVNLYSRVEAQELAIDGHRSSSKASPRQSTR